MTLNRNTEVTHLRHRVNSSTHDQVVCDASHNIVMDGSGRMLHQTSEKCEEGSISARTLMIVQRQSCRFSASLELPSSALSSSGFAPRAEGLQAPAMTETTATERLNESVCLRAR